MNWELADRVKMRLKPGQRVYGYLRVSGKRKKVDSYSVTQDLALVGPEFETFITDVEPCEVEVRDSNGYVTSCRLTCERSDKSESWTEDIDPETIGMVMAMFDEPNVTPKQVILQLMSMMQKPKEIK